MFSVTFILILTLFTSQAVADCEIKKEDRCHNKEKALPLKIIAICVLFVASILGVCLPLVTRSIPGFGPDGDLFIIVKSFTAGIILGTGFIHVLPDSFDMLWSECLPETWHEYPFSGLVAMFTALITMMVDSLATSFCFKRHRRPEDMPNHDHPEGGDQEMGTAVNTGHHHHHHAHHHHNHAHHHRPDIITENRESQLMHFRVVASVLEIGIVIHSVVVGISIGASSNTCTIESLVAAMCFHQLFEGMGLGGCILRAEYTMLKVTVFISFFSVITPLGIALGMGISKGYRENSPSSLIIVGLLNAASAGILIYMALVVLLAADFTSPRLQGCIRLQLKSYVAVYLGAGAMSLVAKWA